MDSVKMSTNGLHAQLLSGKVDCDLTGKGDFLTSPPPIYIVHSNPTSFSGNSFDILDGHHRTMSATTAAHPIINNIDIGFISRKVHFQVLDL